ncbi:hypothetical protein GXW84_10410 [Rhodococcus sp. IEGM 248]|jgi:hypothetical protein|nr:hypothetical protein [Rhodococcus sp. IEGM 248]
MSTSARRAAVAISLPTAVARIGRDLFAEMGLDARPGANREEWLVRDAILRPPGRGQALVETKTLAAPWLSSDKFDLLTLPPHDLAAPSLTPAAFEAERQKIAARTNATSLTAPLYGIQVDLMEAKDADLVEVTRACHRKLRDVQFDGEAGPVFPTSTAHVVSVHESLYQRSKLPSILLRFEQDPNFVDDMTSGRKRPSTGRMVFASGAELAGPGFFNGTYLGHCSCAGHRKSGLSIASVRWGRSSSVSVRQSTVWT